MARLEGFEPPTAWFVARYSIQLSYGRGVKRGIMEKRGGYVNPDLTILRIWIGPKLRIGKFSGSS